MDKPPSSRRLQALEALAERGATPGERAAAAKALGEARARQPKASDPLGPGYRAWVEAVMANRGDRKIRDDLRRHAQAMDPLAGARIKVEYDVADETDGEAWTLGDAEAAHQLRISGEPVLCWLDAERWAAQVDGWSMEKPGGEAVIRLARLTPNGCQVVEKGRDDKGRVCYRASMSWSDAERLYTERKPVLLFLEVAGKAAVHFIGIAVSTTYRSGPGEVAEVVFAPYTPPPRC